MSNAQWEYENQDFLKARYENKKWYTVRKHVCLECGKEYYTICNFRKYCSDACCKSAEQKWTEERKSAHHSEHICKVCGKSFSSKRTDAQYCSNKCRQKSSVLAENDNQYTYTLEYRLNYNSEAYAS